MDFTYLDYAATTPLSEAVKNTLIEAISNQNDFFNSGSSTYEQAEVLNRKIELARENIAKTIDVLPREIVFTSGATESNNLAIKGAAFAYRHKGNHIITSKAEHKAVLDVCKYLETDGFEISYLDVDSTGKIDIKELENTITDKTILISLMAVNNELGTINDSYEIGKIAKKNKIIFHIDAAQAYGKVDLDIKAMGIDLLSMSGHKIYAPKGVGFLFVRSKAPRVKLHKQMHGGTQEFNLRAGTLANYQIFALATACKEMFAKKEQNYQLVLAMRDLFLGELYSGEILNQVQDDDSCVEGECQLQLNTDLKNSYPGILSITFKGVKGEALLAMLDGVCLSMGSACNSQAVEPSHVLSAIGLSADEADSTIRISFGLMTTKQEVLMVTKLIKEKISLLKAISPNKEGDYV
ncbi:cysteine desulfurase family protein [Francisellaceae bacterium CB300]